jgi:hypothetical protein
MRPLQAHCHRGLGTLYATLGQQEQARTELSAAIVLYRAMDTTFWLPQTEAALAQVDSRVRAYTHAYNVSRKVVFLSNDWVALPLPWLVWLVEKLGQQLL